MKLNVQGQQQNEIQTEQEPLEQLSSRNTRNTISSLPDESELMPPPICSSSINTRSSKRKEPNSTQSTEDSFPSIICSSQPENPIRNSQSKMNISDVNVVVGKRQRRNKNVKE